jgi:hypothetical protein
MLTKLLKNKGFYPLLLLVLFVILQYIDVITNDVLLADDLSKIIELNSTGFWKFIENFLTSTNMTSRPVSGFVTAVFIYISKYNHFLYFGGLLFFLVSLILIYCTTIKIFKNDFTGLLITLIYAFIPIGTSTVFSPIMLNSSLAVIFYCISILFILKNNSIKNILLSLFFLILSILSYEIFLPLVVFHLYFIKSKKKSVIYLFSIIFLYLFYKKLIEPNVFLTYYKRESLPNILDFKRNVKIITLTFKLYLRDLPISIFNGIKSIQFYTFKDYFAILVFNIGVIITICNKKIVIKPQKNNIYRYLFLFVLAHCIFLFSAYIPTIYGFDNRNLGAIRLFFSIALVLFILQLLSKTLKASNFIIKLYFCTLIFILSINFVSVKNAWVYANYYNLSIFRELSKKIPSKPLVKTIFVKYNLFEVVKSNPHFLMREQIFYYPWEAKYLAEKTNIRQDINVIYYNEKKVTYPCYIYSVNHNKLIYKYEK